MDGQAQPAPSRMTVPLHTCTSMPSGLCANGRELSTCKCSKPCRCEYCYTAYIHVLRHHAASSPYYLLPRRPPPSQSKWRICRATPPPKTWLIFLFSLFEISRDGKPIVALLDRAQCSTKGLLAAFLSGVFHSFLYGGRESVASASAVPGCPSAYYGRCPKKERHCSG